MQLSKKQKTFCQFFFRIFKIYIIFKHLQKKDDLHSSCISGNTVSEKFV